MLDFDKLTLLFEIIKLLASIHIKYSEECFSEVMHRRAVKRYSNDLSALTFVCWSNESKCTRITFRSSYY